MTRRVRPGRAGTTGSGLPQQLLQILDAALTEESQPGLAADRGSGQAITRSVYECPQEGSWGHPKKTPSRATSSTWGRRADTAASRSLSSPARPRASTCSTAR